MTDRDQLAASIYAQIMATAQGIGDLSLEKRQNIYGKVADLCFEMADAFIKKQSDY